MRQSVFVVAVVASSVVTSAQPAATSATVPLDASTNSTIVEFTIQKRDGTPRKARFLVDTGGGAFILAEPLANEIGAEPTGPVEKGDEGSMRRSRRRPSGWATCRLISPACRRWRKSALRD